MAPLKCPYNIVRRHSVIRWCNNRTFDRYLVFLYKTTEYSGELLLETDEGRVFWISPADIINYPAANDFEKYLPMFFESKHSEAFGLWNESESWEIVYK